MKIYRSIFPGDEKSKSVLTTLTDVEASILEEVESLQKLINIGEIAKHELNELRSRCSHGAFTTAESTLLGTRTCAACGAQLGLFLRSNK